MNSGPKPHPNIDQINRIYQLSQMEHSGQSVDELFEELPMMYSLLPKKDRMQVLEGFINAEIYISPIEGGFGDNITLDRLLHNYERLLRMADAAAFDAIASFHKEDPAFTRKGLRASGLRPEKIRDITSALEASSLSPQLHEDISDHRLTVGDVADIGQSAQKLAKEDLTIPQQRRLLNAGRKPLLEHRQTNPTKPLRSTHARKAIATAVRSSCPTRVKEPTIKPPRADYGVRITKRTITLTAPRHVIGALAERLTSHAAPYIPLFSADAPPVNPNILKEKTVPSITVPTVSGGNQLGTDTSGDITDCARQQAQGFSLVHALMVGCETLTQNPWDQDFAHTPHTARTTKPPKVPVENLQGKKGKGPHAAGTKSTKLTRHQRRKARKRMAKAAGS